MIKFFDEEIEKKAKPHWERFKKSLEDEISQRVDPRIIDPLILTLIEQAFLAGFSSCYEEDYS